MGEHRDTPPLLCLEGERVALGPLRHDLAPVYCAWHNAVETTRTYALPVPITLEQQEALIATLSTSPDQAFFTVYERAAWQPIGMTYLTNIDHRHRSAEFGILIGEPAWRGQGLGTEATRLTLDFAFSVLGLHNVMLTVYAYNLAGQRAYAKAGFRECGRRRECHWMGGKLWDEISMDCLATEFTSPVLERIFVPDSPRKTGDHASPDQIPNLEPGDSPA